VERDVIDTLVALIAVSVVVGCAVGAVHWVITEIVDDE
jgi:hypothetical protein